MAPLSHSQEVQIQWGKLSIAVHRRSGQVARRLQQLNSSGFRSFPCFDLLRVYAEFFWVWHFLFVFFLFPTALPSAMLMPVSFCTVCALLVVSNMWGVCFAVFVQWETLCFVSVLQFPLAAVKVLWRFPLCGNARETCEPPHPAGKQKENLMSYSVVLISALVCELHGSTCSFHEYKDTCNLHGHEGHSNVAEAGSIRADGQGWHAPVEPLLGCVCTAWLPHTRLDAETCSS